MSAALSPDNNKAIARRAIEEIWNKGNLAVVDELYADDAPHNDPAWPVQTAGAEGIKQAAEIYRSAFPDLHLAIEDTIAEGDQVVVRWRSTGTHEGELQGIQPTGKQINLTGISISRIADGKIVEEWVNWDTLGMMKQLGVITE
jgi:steroid delta-isomerase-like uncharacterized protein